MIYKVFFLPIDQLTELLPDISFVTSDENTKLFQALLYQDWRHLSQVVQIVLDNKMDSAHYNTVNPELPPLNPRPIMPAIWLTDIEPEAAYRTNLSPSVWFINLNDVVIPRPVLAHT